jgi:hypothetical protein
VSHHDHKRFGVKNTRYDRQSYYGEKRKEGRLPQTGKSTTPRAESEIQYSEFVVVVRERRIIEPRIKKLLTHGERYCTNMPSCQCSLMRLLKRTDTREKHLSGEPRIPKHRDNLTNNVATFELTVSVRLKQSDTSQAPALVAINACIREKHKETLTGIPAAANRAVALRPAGVRGHLTIILPWSFANSFPSLTMASSSILNSLTLIG